MADKWLKFTFQIYVDITSGTKYMTLSSDLPMSAFPNNNLLYQLNYGTGDILANVRMPGKLRLYQFITKFNNHNLLDVMNPNGTNQILTGTDPDDINNVPVNPSDEELIYTSDLGTENTYIEQVYESAVGHRVYVSHNEIWMGSQKTPEVSTQTTITCENIYLFHDNEMDLYNALLELYPNNVSEYDPAPPQPVHDLYVGDEQVSVLYHGDERIDKAYLGDKVVLRNLQANIIIISG